MKSSKSGLTIHVYCKFIFTYEWIVNCIIHSANEWYPRGIQISLHIWSPRLQAYGGVFQSKLWSSQIWSFSVCVCGGVFWSKLWPSQIWSFSVWGEGYFRVNFGHLKSEVFQLGGVFRSKLWSSQIWSSSVWGVFQSKLWLSKIWSFPWGGGGFLVWNSRKGLSGEFGQKCTVWGMCTETCLCITDSLSHTTYVETNQCFTYPYIVLCMCN